MAAPDVRDDRSPAAGPGRMSPKVDIAAADLSLSLPTWESESIEPHLDVLSPNLLPTCVMMDLSNGAAAPKFGLSSNSGFEDCPPFEYAFQGLLAVVSSAACRADLCAPLEDKAGALIGRYLNRGTVEHLMMFEPVFDFVGNFWIVSVYMRLS